MTAPLATGRAGLQVTGTLTRSIAVEAVRALRPDPTRFAKSARIVACIAGPLAVGVALGEPQYGMAAAFGAFAGFHGHGAPYPRRARLLAFLVVAYLLAVLAGTLATTSTVALVLVSGTFAGVAAFVCQALALPAPREFMLILVCLLTGGLPSALAPTPLLVGLTLAGGAWAWVVLMSGWFTDRERPERMAVRTALTALLDLLEQPGPPDLALQHDAVLATRTARRAVEFARGPTAPLLRDLQLAAENLLDTVLGLGPLPSHDEAQRAAERSTDAAPDPRVELRLRARELLARTDAALPRRGLRRGARVRGQLPPMESGLWPLRNALGRQSLVIPMASRVGVAVGAGLLIGELSGAPRAYWIALTAAAVLQGSTLLMTARRSIERAAGTLMGIGLAAVALVVEPSQAGIVAAIAVLLFLAQSTIATSYVVAVVFLTPTTLLLAELALPGQLTEQILGWRLIDTVVGALLGVAAGRVLWPGSARVRLDTALARTLTRIQSVLHPASHSTRESRRACRHDLRVQALNLRAVTDSGLGDRLTVAPREDQLWPLAASAQQLAYRALAARGEPDPALDVELARLTAEVAQRCEAMAGRDD